MIRLFLICALLGVSLTYPTYQQAIPNGGSVPSPCPGNRIWAGVGHINRNGGGVRNLFGLDFASSAHAWTHDLCIADSDSDGVSNGAELGDPNCVWTTGHKPEHNATGHPGICEPMDNSKCLSLNTKNNITC
ncbi:temptin-like [Ylistrum balloti]|uniref:temptin-like n=1 Tax=Ylistrum balloti TaxID=509963 RepID=UPI002905F349|nr:temptin-like [Ylistrum balloti]